TKKNLFSNNLKTKEAHIQELLTIGNNDIIVLDPHYFKSKILNCSEIIEVCTINDITYIQYNTAQGDYAILSIKNDTPIQ
ncbi:MAG: hypothetical protein Q4B89_03385, partial [Lachnospiraceae bacterium]|nr:hypothetical protein [Lachnospiraceae bacterium]